MILNYHNRTSLTSAANWPDYVTQTSMARQILNLTSFSPVNPFNQDVGIINLNNAQHGLA